MARLSGSAIAGTDLASTAATTTTVSSAKRIAEAHGLDIDQVKHVSSTVDIKGEPNTAYAVSGRLAYKGPIRIQGADDTAIVAISDDAHLRIPPGQRGYDLRVGGGSGFLWFGVDLDQRKPGAWGRLHGACQGGAIFKGFETIGSGRRADPDPSSGLSSKSGSFLYAPARDESRTNYAVNITNDHGGVYDDEHEGDRPIGIWLGGSHAGTLKVVGCRLTGFPNNAIYASACPGPVEVEDCEFLDNGVTNGRIAHGHFKRVEVSFDASRDLLGNAHAPEHGMVGLAAEQKNKGANGEPGPDIIDCEVEIINAGKCGGGIVTYDIHRPAKIGTVRDTDVHIHKGASARTADLDIRGSCERIVGCELSGTADDHVSINNQGPAVEIDDLTHDYPSGRDRVRGATA